MISHRKQLAGLAIALIAFGLLAALAIELFDEPDAPPVASLFGDGDEQAPGDQRDSGEAPSGFASSEREIEEEENPSWIDVAAMKTWSSESININRMELEATEGLVRVGLRVIDDMKVSRPMSQSLQIEAELHRFSYQPGDEGEEPERNLDWIFTEPIWKVGIDDKFERKKTLMPAALDWGDELNFVGAFDRDDYIDRDGNPYPASLIEVEFDLTINLAGIMSSVYLRRSISVAMEPQVISDGGCFDVQLSDLLCASGCIVTLDLKTESGDPISATGGDLFLRISEQEGELPKPPYYNDPVRMMSYSQAPSLGLCRLDDCVRVGEWEVQPRECKGTHQPGTSVFATPGRVCFVVQRLAVAAHIDVVFSYSYGTRNEVLLYSSKEQGERIRLDQRSIDLGSMTLKGGGIVRVTPELEFNSPQRRDEFRRWLARSKRKADARGLGSAPFYHRRCVEAASRSCLDLPELLCSRNGRIVAMTMRMPLNASLELWMPEGDYDLYLAEYEVRTRVPNDTIHPLDAFLFDGDMQSVSVKPGGVHNITLRLEELWRCKIDVVDGKGNAIKEPLYILAGKADQGEVDAFCAPGGAWERTSPGLKFAEKNGLWIDDAWLQNRGMSASEAGIGIRIAAYTPEHAPGVLTVLYKHHRLATIKLVERSNAVAEVLEEAFFETHFKLIVTIPNFPEANDGNARCKVFAESDYGSERGVQSFTLKSEGEPLVVSLALARKEFTGENSWVYAELYDAHSWGFSDGANVSGLFDAPTPDQERVEVTLDAWPRSPYGKRIRVVSTRATCGGVELEASFQAETPAGKRFDILTGYGRNESLPIVGASLVDGEARVASESRPLPPTGTSESDRVDLVFPLPVRALVDLREALTRFSSLSLTLQSLEDESVFSEIHVFDDESNSVISLWCPPGRARLEVRFARELWWSTELELSATSIEQVQVPRYSRDGIAEFSFDIDRDKVFEVGDEVEYWSVYSLSATGKAQELCGEVSNGIERREDIDLDVGKYVAIPASVEMQTLARKAALVYFTINKGETTQVALPRIEEIALRGKQQKLDPPRHQLRFKVPTAADLGAENAIEVDGCYAIWTWPEYVELFSEMKTTGRGRYLDWYSREREGKFEDGLVLLDGLPAGITISILIRLRVEEDDVAFIQRAILTTTLTETQTTDISPKWVFDE